MEGGRGHSVVDRAMDDVSDGKGEGKGTHGETLPQGSIELNKGAVALVCVNRRALQRSGW